MGKRQNIGVYIGPDDMDICAWLNLLQVNGLSRAKWARGLFAAYALGVPLDIGTVNPSQPSPKAAGDREGLLFGVGNSQQQPPSGRYDYGWHIRGPNREFIQGSVVNVSIRKDEILPIVDMVWSNGHQLATFFKALIRKNLKYGDRNIPPNYESLQKVWSDFMVKQAEEPVAGKGEGKRPVKDRPAPEPQQRPETPPAPAAGEPVKRKNVLLDQIS